MHSVFLSLSSISVLYLQTILGTVGPKVCQAKCVCVCVCTQEMSAHRWDLRTTRRSFLLTSAVLWGACSGSASTMPTREPELACSLVLLGVNCNGNDMGEDPRFGYRVQSMVICERHASLNVEQHTPHNTATHSTTTPQHHNTHL